MDIIKSAEWEGEPLYNMLSEDEKAFADSLLKLAEELGPLDQSEGIWIGYEDGSTNENASIGVKCGNCALHKSAVACAIISQQIEEEGACRLAVIPDGYVNADEKNTGEEFMEMIPEMSKADSVRVGQMVSWNSSGGAARGKVVRVVRSGSINVPNSDFTITGTADNPAALIRIYRDGKPTDTLVGHRVATLSISSSKSHDGNDDVIGNDDVPNKRPHSIEDCEDEKLPRASYG